MNNPNATRSSALTLVSSSSSPSAPEANTKINQNSELFYIENMLLELEKWVNDVTNHAQSAGLTKTAQILQESVSGKLLAARSAIFSKT